MITLNQLLVYVFSNKVACVCMLSPIFIEICSWHHVSHVASWHVDEFVKRLHVVFVHLLHPGVGIALSKRMCLRVITLTLVASSE